MALIGQFKVSSGTPKFRAPYPAQSIKDVLNFGAQGTDRPEIAAVQRYAIMAYRTVIYPPVPRRLIDRWREDFALAKVNIDLPVDMCISAKFVLSG